MEWSSYRIRRFNDTGRFVSMKRQTGISHWSFQCCNACRKFPTARHDASTLSLPLQLKLHACINLFYLASSSWSARKIRKGWLLWWKSLLYDSITASFSFLAIVSFVSVRYNSISNKGNSGVTVKVWNRALHDSIVQTLRFLQLQWEIPKEMAIFHNFPVLLSLWETLHWVSEALLLISQ